MFEKLATEMDLNRVERNYLRLFCILGAHTKLQRKSPSLRLIGQICPFILLIAIVLSTGLGLMSRVLSPQFFIVHQDVSIDLYIISQFVTSLSFYYQVLLRKQYLCLLWSQFHKIDCYMRIQLNYKMCFRKFLRHYYQMIALLFSIVVALMCIMYSIISPKVHKLLQANILVFQWNAMYLCVHTIFYIQLFSHFIELFQKYIAAQCRHIGKNQLLMIDVFEQLRHFRNIYYKIWEASGILNKYFGICFIYLCFRAIVDTAYAVFWVVTYINSETLSYLVIRNGFTFIN